ncbi:MULTISPECIES: acyltransferase [Rhodococcus]|uniref:Acetyltransferase n=1 Tax=Rhodococcus opacus RKJ300 = JCM 13270 TaxID=1165867 RepID=I0WV04_RHOOP|nr:MULTISPECIES: acyltransferase [Rhodococcus]EID80220.1 acetyltransferase [Rhodococcus opacus RKJ300 = JCM 13270]QQZ17709.1 acyltransferase [Rhodococcus sp. 21391]
MRFVTIVQASAFVPVWLRVLLLMAAGAKVWGAGICSGCHFGSKDVTMGLGTFVNRGVLFDGTAPITLGRQVAVGHRAQFITSTHEIGPSSGRGGRVVDRPIVIGDGCWIGAGAIILPGVTVGDGCVIGAGTVVTRDCEPNGLYAGSPARRVRDLDSSPSVR